MKEPLTFNARKLRNNPTESEKYLWYMLRNSNLGVKFRRQVVVGQYIVDFACFESRLIIEVDGGQHTKDGCDEVRDKWFKSQGFRILRFWNNDVLKNRDGVLERIIEHLKFSPPPPSPPREGEGIKV